jgi:putative tryptophan/tyrosine transport system substrate-binding protein
MKRRDFIGALLLTPLAGSAIAQHSTAMKRIALVQPAGRVADMKIGGDSNFTIFFQELQRLGFVEGQTLTIERYSAGGDKERYADLAREVVSIHPDIIVAGGTPITRLLMAATTSIPILTITGDPIRQGLVTNIAHPGGNVTGVSVDAGFELWGKRLELLGEAVPKLRNVLFVSTATAPSNFPGGKVTSEVAQKLGISLIGAQVSTPRQRTGAQAYVREDHARPSRWYYVCIRSRVFPPQAAARRTGPTGRHPGDLRLA